MFYTKINNLINNNIINKLGINNTFAVYVEDGIESYSYQTIMNTIFANNLTIAGDGTNEAKKLDHTFITAAVEPVFLLFGTSQRFDVEIATGERVMSSKKLQKINPVYTVNNTNELYEVIEAITQFSEKKQDLQSKYPRNMHSHTMRNLTSFESAKRKENKKKTKSYYKVTPVNKVTDEVRVFSNFIIVNGKVFKRGYNQDVTYVTSDGTSVTYKGFNK